MKDLLLIIYLVVFFLYSGGAIFLVWKFKNRSMNHKVIQRKDLYKVIAQLVSLSFATYLAMLLILNFDSILENSSQGEFNLVTPPIICLAVIVLFPFGTLYTQFSMLRIMGIPIVD